MAFPAARYSCGAPPEARAPRRWHSPCCSRTDATEGTSLEARFDVPDSTLDSVNFVNGFVVNAPPGDSNVHIEGWNGQAFGRPGTCATSPRDQRSIPDADTSGDVMNRTYLRAIVT